MVGYLTTCGLSVSCSPVNCYICFVFMNNVAFQNDLVTFNRIADQGKAAFLFVDFLFRRFPCVLLHYLFVLVRKICVWRGQSAGLRYWQLLRRQYTRSTSQGHAAQHLQISTLPQAASVAFSSFSVFSFTGSCGNSLPYFSPL